MANSLLSAELILYLRGTLIFRCQPFRVLWDVAGSLVLLALFFWLTYVEPSLNARIAVSNLLSAVWYCSISTASLGVAEFRPTESAADA